MQPVLHKRLVAPVLQPDWSVERIGLTRDLDPWAFVAALPGREETFYWRDPVAEETVAATFAVASGYGVPDRDVWAQWCSRCHEHLGVATRPRLWFAGAPSGSGRVGPHHPAERLWMLPGLTVARDKSGVYALLCGDDALRDRLRWLVDAPLGVREAATATRAIDLTCREIRLDDEAAWSAQVDAVLDAIRAGRVTKVVPSRRVRFITGAPDGVRRHVRRWLQGAADRVALLVETPDGCFAAATPETLFAVDAGGTLRTHALAGTLPPGAPLYAFVDNARLREEHALVVEDIATALAALGLRPQIGAPRVRSAGAVAHLETPIVAPDAGRISPGTLVEALHPTAAIVGAPRNAAAAVVREIEPFDRGWFASPAGWMDGRRSRAVVAIRSVWVDDDSVYALVGAGIVADCDPASEWEETERKLDNMRQMIGFGSG